jgi:hypothetical protein
MELPDSISIDTSLSICVFHFNASRPTVCFERIVSPRFQPDRSASPPHVSHSRERPLCACTFHEMLPRQKTSTRHVARIIVMATSRKVERREYVRVSEVSTVLRPFSCYHRNTSSGATAQLFTESPPHMYVLQ